MKADQVRALIQAHYQNNHEFFRSLSLQIAASSAERSPKLAAQIRTIVDRNAATMIALPMPIDTKGMFTHSQPTTRLGEMVLDGATSIAVGRLLEEQRHAMDLRIHGQKPARKLLLSGAPGIGKTMLASALAGELGLPLMRVNQHAVISQYLGETGAKLAKVFDVMRTVRAVYLFDEFDSLAQARTSKKDDVGEMVRVVNSLLQFIENDEGDGIVVAATNAIEMIDRAMFRRFDAVIAMPDPTFEGGRRLLQHRLPGASLDLAHVERWFRDKSYADLAAACDRAIKTRILKGSDDGFVDGVSAYVTTDDLVAELR